jgi:amidase
VKPAGWLLNREIAFVPYCGVFNHTGQPAIAVPAGFTAEQLPLSTQFVGRPGSEDVLVSLAAQLEPVIGWADARPPVAA